MRTASSYSWLQAFAIRAAKTTLPPQSHASHRERVPSCTAHGQTSNVQPLQVLSFCVSPISEPRETMTVGAPLRRLVQLVRDLHQFLRRLASLSSVHSAPSSRLRTHPHKHIIPNSVLSDSICTPHLIHICYIFSSQNLPARVSLSSKQPRYYYSHHAPFVPNASTT